MQSENFVEQKKWWGRKVLGHLGRPKKLVTNIKLNIKRVVGKEGILIAFSWVKKWDTSIFYKIEISREIFSGGHIFFLKKISNFFDLLRISEL